MQVNLALLGMVLIIVSWLIQISFSLGSKKEMRLCFAGLQALGIILLVVNTWLSLGALDTLAWLNVASAGGALVMVGLLLRGCKAKAAPPPTDHPEDLGEAQ